jgi:AraC family transcriptional regulator
MAFEITLKERSAQPILSITTKTTPQDISKAFSEIMPKVKNFVLTAGAQQAGPPFSRFHEYAQDEVIIEAGIPVCCAVTGEGDIRSSELPAGEVAQTVHVGPYDELMKVYPALVEWFTLQGKQSNGSPWEVYLTDPGNEPNPSKWQTEINWPVR